MCIRDRPIKELTRGILEIANHNYEKRLDMSGHEEFRQVADSFNSMAERLTEYLSLIHIFQWDSMARWR